MTPPMTPPSGPPTRLRRRITLAAAVYLAFVVLAWAAVEYGGDARAGPTLALFGPRWLVGLPLLVLLPLAVWARAYRAVGLALVAGVVVAGPVAGGTVNVGPHVRPMRHALVRLRLVTWNMGGVKAGPAFRQFLADARPDVVVFQEADRTLTAADFPAGWTVTPPEDTKPVATWLPVQSAGELSVTQLGAPGGGRRYVLTTDEGPIHLVNLHLPTVRPGIEAAIGSKLRDLRPLRETIAARAAAARTARAWVGDPGPNLLVAGDFNTPPAGRIYADNWAAFANAYSEAGTGWGTTKQTRWFGTRIDHVLYARPWRCQAAWVGPAMGSDHRPLVADLTLDEE